jgi:CDP-diacylglycerol--serine O-phosphatidyltransferase
LSLKLTRHIPNTLTCGNLFCGCLALVKAFEGDLIWTAYLVGIAAILDFFDGFAARMLRATSPIGKDLDSLADMVTFGVVPGTVLFQFMKNAMRLLSDNQIWEGGSWYYNYLPYFGFIISVFSALRLAKFNNDSRQSDSFIGLPTPANAIFFCSFPLVIRQIQNQYANHDNPLEMLVDVSSNPVLALLNSYWFLAVLMLLFSFLLVSELPLFALKFKSFGWNGNQVRYTFLAISALLLIFLRYGGIPVIIVFYILLSLVTKSSKKG